MTVAPAGSSAATCVRAERQVAVVVLDRLGDQHAGPGGQPAERVRGRTRVSSKTGGIRTARAGRVAEPASSNSESPQPDNSPTPSATAVRPRTVPVSVRSVGGIEAVERSVMSRPTIDGLLVVTLRTVPAPAQRRFASSTGERRGRPDQIRVASIPSNHPYVQAHRAHRAGHRPADGDRRGRRSAPARRPAAECRGSAAGPVVATGDAGAAIGCRDHHPEFDLAHLHFGFDAADPATACDAGCANSRGPWTAAGDDRSRPGQPALRRPASHTAHLDVLIPAATELITLTARRRGRHRGPLGPDGRGHPASPRGATRPACRRAANSPGRRNSSSACTRRTSGPTSIRSRC